MEKFITAVKSQFGKNKYSNEFIVAFRMCGWWMPYTGDNNALEFHLLGKMYAIVLDGENWHVETGKTGFKYTKLVPAENFDDACEKLFTEISVFDKLLRIKATEIAIDYFTNLNKYIGKFASFPFIEEQQKSASLIGVLHELEQLAKVYPPQIVRKICKRV